jgi:hypothetical protein
MDYTHRRTSAIRHAIGNSLDSSSDVRRSSHRANPRHANPRHRAIRQRLPESLLKAKPRGASPKFAFSCRNIAPF